MKHLEADGINFHNYLHRHFYINYTISIDHFVKQVAVQSHQYSTQPLNV